MTARQRVRIGLVGGGLMGRELASALGRWNALTDHPVAPELVAVCDLAEPARRWFDRVASVRTTTDDARRLLDDPAIDVLYLAVPHDGHERLYVDAAQAGKDFLGEKPFGIDAGAAERIVAAIASAGVFARCSSEMPYFPGALAALATARAGLGPLVEIRASFLHSSDLDPAKPINWKRRTETCGAIGVMGDLGMHTLHLPLRLGWRPTSVYAVLSDLVRERPDGRGGMFVCDTADNATLLCRVPDPLTGADVPMTVETKRIAPGEMNTWSFAATGLEGGVAFSTKRPKTVRRFALRDGEQVWEERDTGARSAFASVTGPIFEFGFADAVQQMWAAFLAERAGALGDRLGCATPAEALDAHRVFAAALASSTSGRAEAVDPG